MTNEPSARTSPTRDESVDSGVSDDDVSDDEMSDGVVSDWQATIATGKELANAPTPIQFKNARRSIQSPSISESCWELVPNMDGVYADSEPLAIDSVRKDGLVKLGSFEET